ncbi:MAG: hypothetical protein H6873_05465 [Hyphomicrobiaceae bacterium]|nr:hypothetical protein [Hyphomicrobiaceae bacterium]
MSDTLQAAAKKQLEMLAAGDGPDNVLQIMAIGATALAYIEELEDELGQWREGTHPDGGGSGVGHNVADGGAES